MECPLCGHPKIHQHGTTGKGSQRYRCLHCQQTGRWHRKQNKFGQVWPQSAVTLRLVFSYFNWIWRHSRLKHTAAQRAGLTERSWTWQDVATYPTLC